MLQKLKTSHLIIVLMALSGGVIAMFFQDTKKSTSTLPDSILSLDLEAVNALEITTIGEEAYQIKKIETEWNLGLANGKTVAVDQVILMNQLDKLTKAKPKRVVTKNPANWATYELSDDMAVKVNFLQDDKTLTSLYIGKVDFNQQTRSISNYVRLEGDDRVFLVAEALSFDWNKKASDWRNKTIASCDPTSITKIESSGIENYSMVKSDGNGWIKDGINLDSAQIEAFLSDLADIKAANFYDEEISLEGTKMEHQLMIYTETKDIKIEVLDIEGNLYVKSTDNGEALMIADESLLEKLLSPAFGGPQVN